MYVLRVVICSYLLSISYDVFCQHEVYVTMGVNIDLNKGVYDKDVNFYLIDDLSFTLPVTAELGYRYRFSDKFAIGAGLPFFLGKSMRVEYEHRIPSFGVISSREIEGTYKRQSIGALLNVHFSPSRYFYLEGGIGMLYHTEHRISNATVTTINYSFEKQIKQNVEFSFTSRAAFVHRVGLGSEIPVFKNAAIRLNVSLVNSTIRGSKTPYYIPSVHYIGLIHNVGFAVYW